MRVQIGSIEIVDPTWEELEELVRRFGDVQTHEESDRAPRSSGKPGNGSSAADKVVLEQLLKAGDVGVSTADIGATLGRRGKAIPNALQQWARRIGLVTEDGIDPFDHSRPDGRRGVKLKPNFMHVGRELLNGSH